mgnify:CR=1 FL=1
MNLSFASQHSTTFPTFLQQFGVSVLVSTYQAGQLIILRAHNDVLNTHFCALEKPMGLAAQQERLAVGTGYQLWQYANLPAVAAKITEPVQHDGCYLPRHIHVTGDIDIHEMAYDNAGELWLVNTRMSCLCTVDNNHSVVPKWRPPFISAYDLTDRCHLNGLALKHGKPAFVTALGETDSAGGWRDNKANGGLLMDINSGQIICAQLSMPHSPRWYNNTLWYLESGAGQLCQVNPKTGQRKVIAQLPGFTRGLDFIGHYAVIGTSQVRETAVFSGLPLTAQASNRHCGVWIVDIEQGEIVACVTFTGQVQEIFSVLLLPHRFPVILDLDAPLVRNSYALPNVALTEVAKPEAPLLTLEQASLCHNNGDLNTAIKLYRELLTAQPNMLIARYQLGIALADTQTWPDAIAELKQVVQIQANHAEAHNSLGLCYAALSQWPPALAHFDLAIASDHQYALAHVNKSLVLLKLGHYREGFAEYEWRWQTPAFQGQTWPKPKWSGEDISEQTLAVFVEQTASEIIQFARLLPLAAHRCKQLIVTGPESLQPLLTLLTGINNIKSFAELNLDAIDVVCPLLSLAHILAIELTTLPPYTPYLSCTIPTPIYVTPSQQRRIGLCWSPFNDEFNRPEPVQALSDWQAVFNLTNVAWHSLQPSPTPAEISVLTHYQVNYQESAFHDYAQLAALIQQLDLIITVDSTIVHLAGAMGKPTWLILQHASDWRWLLETDTSPWYPTVRIMRQFDEEAWPYVIQRLTHLLS